MLRCKRWFNDATADDESHISTTPLLVQVWSVKFILFTQFSVILSSAHSHICPATDDDADLYILAHLL